MSIKIEFLLKYLGYLSYIFAPCEALELIHLSLCVEIWRGSWRSFILSSRHQWDILVALHKTLLTKKVTYAVHQNITIVTVGTAGY
jgi:hypothetical protein